MKTPKIFFVLLLFLSSLVSLAQENTNSSDKIISFVPQYLINHGIRIDYERRLSDQGWLLFAPQIYLRDVDPSDPNETSREFYQLYGTGLFLYYKHFAADKSLPDGAYINYGVTYNYFYLGYDEQNVTSSVKRYSKINKLGAEVNIGIQTVLRDVLIIDIYAGLGVRYSISQSNANNPRSYNDFYNDFGYTGNLMTLGLRIGLLR